MSTKNRPTRDGPTLAAPHPGWVCDLTLPGESAPRPDGPHPPPPINSMNEIYLEISRRGQKMRGLMLILSLVGIAWLVFAVPKIIIGRTGFSHFIKAIPITVGMLWWTIFMIRVDTAIPRDEPIRFNRLRRKVYVYSFHYIWWNPFARWYVTTRAYNWDDLRAEVWRQRGATGQGGLIFTWGVSIAVVKPGTNQVIDRFPLSVCQDEGSSWDYVRTYMQHGPDALPPIEKLNDPNDVPPHNLALRLAPKVEWPAAMDVESRSGPT